MLKGYAKKTLTALLIICLALGNVFVSLPSGIVQAASSSKQAKKITITPKATQQLAIGEKLKLKAVKSPKNAKGKVIWSISNKAIATVSDKGVVKGKKGGTATITATIKGSKIKANRKIKVLKPASKVSIDKTAVIIEGSTKILKPTFKTKGSRSLLVWKSSNKKVATVSSKGVVKGLKAGTVSITATIKGKKAKAVCKVTVKAKEVLAQSVTVSQTAIGLKEGQTSQIVTTVLPANTTNKAVTYQSSNPAAVTVTASGLITAVQKGRAVITVTTADGSGKKATMEVVVNPVMSTAINASMAKTELVAGETVQISAAVVPANASIKTLKYTSSDPYAATVDNMGLVTALAQGTTTITAEAVDGSGVRMSFELTVDYDRVNHPKSRAIVMTDGEVDDMDSLVRLLLYTNEVDLAGIIQTSASLRWKGSEDAANDAGRYPYRWPGSEWKNEIVDAYEKVYENLRVHDSSYPTPNYLKSITMDGNVDYANDMNKSTDGSNLIKEAILDVAFDRDTRSLSLQAWGGPVTAARALKEIEDEYKNTPQWDEIYNKICDKVVLNVCGFQDSTYDTYIGLSYPDMKAVNIGFGVFAYSTNNQGTPGMQERLSGAWHEENIEFNHGALLDKYITMGDGTYLDGEGQGFQYGANEDLLNNPSVFGGAKERYHFISEGDSPTYFHLLDNGLRETEGENYGGWAGRYVKQNATLNGITLSKRYSSSRDYVTTERSNPNLAIGQIENAQIKWTEQIQNDFAGRADWCIADTYEKANHRPDLSIAEGLDITASPGERVTLNAVTSDPDGDRVSVNWWHYFEAGKEIAGSATNTPLVINGRESNAKNTKKAVFTIPKDAKKGDTFHIIATAEDNGVHNMAYNQRIIVTVDDSKTDYEMEMLMSPAVAENNNTLMSNAPGDMKQIWVKFTPAMPGLGVTWSSSDPDVVSVTATANTTYASMKPLRNGTATITATAKDGSGKSVSVKINIVMVLSKITLAVPEGMSATAMPLGSSVTLTTSLTPGDTGLTNADLKWSSSDTSVATVKDGVVTPLKKGSAIIKALARDGSGTFGVIKLVFTDTNMNAYEMVPETNDTNASNLDTTETETVTEEAVTEEILKEETSVEVMSVDDISEEDVTEEPVL